MLEQTYQVNMLTHVRTDMINGECHCSTQMHMLAIAEVLMFGFSTWNLTVLWRAGGCPLNEDSQFALLEKYELTNSYLGGIKELNCHCVINDWIIVRWYEKAIIYYISTNWLLAQLVPKEWAITPQTCRFLCCLIHKASKKLNTFSIKQ
jgi:hypothetical protein